MERHRILRRIITGMKLIWIKGLRGMLGMPWKFTEFDFWNGLAMPWNDIWGAEGESAWKGIAEIFISHVLFWIWHGKSWNMVHGDILPRS